MTASVISIVFYKIFRIFFSTKKTSKAAFRLDNLVKGVVLCYPRDIVGEFPLECKNDNDNNNNNDDKTKKLPCLRSYQQIKFFVSTKVCNIYPTPR